jgi:hypothetical protein
MSSTNFIPAQVKMRYQRTSYMSHDHEGICNFEVYGDDSSKSIEEFHESYVASRKQLFKDMGLGMWSEDSDMGYQNYLCVLESGDYKLGYYENEFSYRESAQIKCCDVWLSLGKFTNTCDICGADYNGSGQLLASRHVWGEETGEYWTECV